MVRVHLEEDRRELWLPKRVGVELCLERVPVVDLGQHLSLASAPGLGTQRRIYGANQCLIAQQHVRGLPHDGSVAPMQLQIHLVEGNSRYLSPDQVELGDGGAEGAWKLGGGGSICCRCISR